MCERLTNIRRLAMVFKPLSYRYGQTYVNRLSYYTFVENKTWFQLFLNCPPLSSNLHTILQEILIKHLEGNFDYNGGGYPLTTQIPLLKKYKKRIKGRNSLHSFCYFHISLHCFVVIKPIMLKCLLPHVWHYVAFSNFINLKMKKIVVHVPCTRHFLGAHHNIMNIDY